MEEPPSHNHIAIIGTGFSGVAMAVRLIEQGEEDFVIYERSDDVGGTWRDNTYPGCACDVPSLLYSFSFAPNPGWSRAFSPQPEIRNYIKSVARSRGVLPYVRFNHALVEAAWDEAARHWRIETSQGSATADILVSAVGGLSAPSIPDLPGIESFEGPTFHSAEWRHDIDLTGKSVAVIGTGASAIQFVPEIQKKAKKISLFQRTPPWVLPRRDRALRAWEHRLYRRIPAAQRAVRSAIYLARELFVLPMLKPRLARRTEKVALGHLGRQVPDPELRARLTPDYAIGCKRILLSNQYYPALGEDNVEVVTDGISRISPGGVVTSGGEQFNADVIIYGTGFKVADMPVGDQVRGRTGETLHETWKGSPNAYLGTTVAGFPNFFMMVGPNTGLGHTSVTIVIEAQSRLIGQAIGHLPASGSKTIEPTIASMETWKKDIDRLGQGTVWVSGGCDSWYLDETGRNSTLWPAFVTAFVRRIRRFKPSEYRIESGPSEPSVPTAGEFGPASRRAIV